MTIFIVNGEHPFHSCYPMSVHTTEEGATAKAVELTCEFFTDYWNIANEDEPIPEITTDNWQTLVDKYGCDEDFVQNDAWGQWFVAITEQELQP